MTDQAPARAERSGACWLYRLYSQAGELLYVGVADRVIDRAAQHQSGKAWWPQVAEVRSIRCASRGEALYAERVAIEQERPKYNRVHAAPVARTPALDVLVGPALDRAARAVPAAVDGLTGDQLGEQLRALAAAASQLDDAITAVIAHYRADASWDVIAATLGMTPGRVRTHYGRRMRQLGMTPAK